MLTEKSLSLMTSFAFTDMPDSTVNTITVEPKDIFVYRYNLYGYLNSINIPDEIYPFIEIYNAIDNNSFDKPTTLVIPDTDFIQMMTNEINTFQDIAY